MLLISIKSIVGIIFKFDNWWFPFVLAIARVKKRKRQDRRRNRIRTVHIIMGIRRVDLINILVRKINIIIRRIVKININTVIGNIHKAVTAVTINGAVIVAVMDIEIKIIFFYFSFQYVFCSYLFWEKKHSAFLSFSIIIIFFFVFFFLLIIFIAISLLFLNRKIVHSHFIIYKGEMKETRKKKKHS